MFEKQISICLSKELNNEINKILDKGEFRFKSEFIRYLVVQYIKNNHKEDI